MAGPKWIRGWAVAASGLVAGGACGGPPPRVAPDVPPPSVSQVAPASGPTTGGTVVTLTGADFQGGATVKVRGAAATSIVVVSASAISAVTPPGPSGPASVVVTNPDGKASTISAVFTYLAVPTVSALTPSVGDVSGGTPVSIGGAGFSSGATVVIGGSLATGVNVVSSATITCLTPAGSAGSVNVTVTNPSGLAATLSNGFTYSTGGTVPSVSSVAPATGPSAGGTLLTVTGSNFQSGPVVHFARAAATSVTFVSSTTVTAVTPRAPVGTAAVLPVTVTNSGSSGVNSRSPCVALAGSSAVVSWAAEWPAGAPTNFRVRAAGSTDAGIAWSPTAVDVSGAMAAATPAPDVAADGNGAFTVAWVQSIGSPANAEILSARTTDAGENFSLPVNLSSDAGSSVGPAVAGGTGSFLIHVWADDTASSGRFDVVSY